MTPVADYSLPGFEILWRGAGEVEDYLRPGFFTAPFVPKYAPYSFAFCLLPFMFMAWVRWRYGIFMFAALLPLMLSNWGFYLNWTNYYSQPGAWVWSASFALMLIAASIGWRSTLLLDATD
jgi:hypothetical protein